MNERAGTGGWSPAIRSILILLVVVVGVLLIWQGGRRRDEPVPRTVTLYCFSAMADVMNQGILPAFQDFWRDRTGEDVEFITTFAGSGTITERIIQRFPAEVAVLSSEVDALHLTQTGVVVGPTWRQLPEGGVMCRSPIIFLVHGGNPKRIASYRDLSGEGVRIVHADPATSGVGNWAILGAYGAFSREGESEDGVLRLMRKMWGNGVATTSSARAARSRFAKGEGDVILTYEEEGIGPNGEGEGAFETVWPERTILSEHVVVRISRNVKADQRAVVDGLVDFFWSETAQDLLVEYGFRSVQDDRNARSPAFGEVADLFTMTDLGGAEVAQEKIIEGLWRKRVLPESSDPE